MVFMMVKSLRMQARMTTFAGLPVCLSRCAIDLLPNKPIETPMQGSNIQPSQKKLKLHSIRKPGSAHRAAVKKEC
jgi:hypothetical protein